MRAWRSGRGGPQARVLCSERFPRSRSQAGGQGRGPGKEPSPRCSAGNRTADPRLLFARIYLGLILTIPVGGGGDLELLST